MVKDYEVTIHVVVSINSDNVAHAMQEAQEQVVNRMREYVDMGMRRPVKFVSAEPKEAKERR